MSTGNSPRKNATDVQEEIEHLNALLSIQRRRLRYLELQHAKLGSMVPPQIIMEAYDLQDAIKEIENKLNISEDLSTSKNMSNDKQSIRGQIYLLIFILLTSITVVSLSIYSYIQPRIATFNLQISIFILLAVLLLSLVIAATRYFTSRGEPEALKEARLNITTILIGLISVFFGFSISILLNFFSEDLSQIISGNSNFLETILSIVFGLLGVIFSFYFYSSQKAGDIKKQVDRTRSSQNIVSDNDKKESSMTKRNS